MPLVARWPEGTHIDPGAAVTPIFAQIAPGILAVIGTGFYITRYGLVLTAKHVAACLQAPEAGRIRPSWTWHLPAAGQVVLRSVRAVTYDTRAPHHFPDLAVLQVDNFIDLEKQTALANPSLSLSTSIPPIGAPVATFAYPQNYELDLRSKGTPATMHADSYEGAFLEVVPADDHSPLKYIHFRTSIDVRDGASGGPAFGPDGHVFAINCRGMTFIDGSHSSTLVPATAFLQLVVGGALIPPWSAEYTAIPEHRRATNFTGRELVDLGHVKLVG